jgi:hypothetical protein
VACVVAMVAAGRRGGIQLDSAAGTGAWPCSLYCELRRPGREWPRHNRYKLKLKHDRELRLTGKLDLVHGTCTKKSIFKLEIQSKFKKRKKKQLQYLSSLP